MSKRLLVCLLILTMGMALLAGCFPFPKKYTLNVTITGEGTVSPANGQYKAGTSVTLTATPKANWRFDNWGGGAFGHRSTITVVMKADMEITAHFSRTQYAVNTSVEGQGTVEQRIVENSKEIVNAGEIVELKAVPAVGWHFKEWQGDLTGSLNPARITVDKEYNVKAVFTQNAAPVKWNFLVYLDGDNSLEEVAIEDINEMEEIGSTEDVNILALVDRTPHYDSSNGDWTGTRLYRITKDADHSNNIVSELVHDYGELDMSDPQVLENFLLFCQNAYPAERTTLTLWDHGDGVYPKNTNRNNQAGTITPQGICWDDTTGMDPWLCLTTDEIAATLADVRAVTGKKIEIINMDACLMQSIEIAYEWRNEVNYLVGSQADVPGGGNNYAALLQVLTNDPMITTLGFAETLVDEYYNYYTTKGKGFETYSALSLGVEFDNLITAFKDFATALKSTTDLKGAYISWKNVTHFTVREYDDLYDLADNLITNSLDVNVVNKAKSLQEALGNAIVKHHETANYQGNAFGLSILLASNDEWPNYSAANQYTSLLLSKDTDWDEFILRFVDYVNVNSPGLLQKVEISWPSGNCDLGILEPNENFYWSDQGSSPNGVFSQDMKNGGTESWTLNASHASGVYIPQVFSYNYAGTVNFKLTFKCGIFNAAVDVTPGFGYSVADLQLVYLKGVPKLTYKVNSFKIQNR